MPQTRTSPEGITQQLAKALAHPLRVRILSSLHKGISSPNQLSQELGEPLGNVSYHVKTLLEYDCVELVKTEPRRGAVEHFYRATERAFFSDADWAKIPASARKGINGVVLEAIGQDATAAMVAGTIDARTDSHVSHTPLLLDEQGWSELTTLLTDTLSRAIEIQEESAARLADDEGRGDPHHAGDPPLREARREFQVGDLGRRAASRGPVGSEARRSASGRLLVR